MAIVASDIRFDQRFSGRLMQVFLYVTDECNLRCTHCYYKPVLKKSQAEMPTHILLALLKKFRELGAIKVTILGGEPTLYGQNEGNKSLPFLISAAREMGFEYIRIVTNGVFDKDILLNKQFREANEIAFSIDGDTEEIHDKLRGKGKFEQSLQNLRTAVRLGYPVTVTMCAHRGNIGRLRDGTPILSRAIKWAASLGVKSLNIHPLFRMGVARDAWTGDTDIEQQEWMSVYKDIQTAIKSGEYGIPIRVPLRFASDAAFDENKKLYSYCSVKSADRIDVHPDGQIHTCALHNGTPISVSTFEVQANQVFIKWTEQNNELAQSPFKDDEDHPCVVMKRPFDGLRPLCVSIKPGQDEFIWNRTHKK